MTPNEIELRLSAFASSLLAKLGLDRGRPVTPIFFA